MATHKLRPTHHLTVRFALTRAKELLRHPLFWFLSLLANSAILAGAGLLFALERDVNPNVTSFFDAVWWSVSTITTVGYGDIIPQTTGGRITGMVLMLFGTAVFGSFTALFAATLLKPEMDEVEDEVHRLQKRLP